MVNTMPPDGTDDPMQTIFRNAFRATRLVELEHIEKG